MPIAANSTAKWGPRLRVALVLDNTGSMSKGGTGTANSPTKIQALKTASHNLLTQLQSAATNPGDVYVSIIPFAKDVNANPAQTYVEWSVWDAEPANSKPSNWNQIGPGSSCPFSTNGYGFGCTDKPGSAATTTINTIPSSGNTKGLICPGVFGTDSSTPAKTIPIGDNGSKNPTHSWSLYNGCYDSTNSCTGASCTCPTGASCTTTGSGSSKIVTINTAGYYFHTWRPPGNANATPDHTTWNGCVTDRPQPFDTTNTTPTSGNTQFSAEQYSTCPVSLVAQTYDWTALGNKIDAMAPNGGTNQAIGLAWGWQSLTAGAPLNAPAKDANYEYEDIIIILSDGLNTQDRWNGDGTQWSQPVDARQQILCDNFKAQNTNPNKPNFMIYTIQVNTDNEATSSVLQYCAGSQQRVGDTTKFFQLTSPSDIITTFNTIGNELTRLHLAY
jgi:hypothetical protein